jgi:hypothetical protein
MTALGTSALQDSDKRGAGKRSDDILQKLLFQQFERLGREQEVCTIEGHA